MASANGSLSMRSRRILATEVHIGSGSFELLPEVVARVGQRGETVVVLGQAARTAIWSGQVTRLIAGLNAQVIEVPAGLVTATTTDTLQASASRSPGVVVAIGGGRIIDAAKLLVAKWAEADAVGVPIVAVPTTAGSGSELTPFATRWNVESRRKESVSGEELAPRAAIIDPLLASTCSTAVAAAAAFDALSQAIESGWSTKSTPQSLDWSLQAVSLLKRGFVYPDGITSRGALVMLSEGALLAGAAIAVANTTAPHGVSYPLTLEFDLLHGHSVALTLGRFIRFNAEVTQAECEDSRGMSHMQNVIHSILECLDVRDALEAERWVNEALAHLGLSPLAGLSFDAERVAVEALSYDRTSNNPRRLEVEVLAKLLRGEMWLARRGV
jgi:alcohol dehydrogenase class IV